jgi:formate C-acetyltransferase
MDQSPTYQQRIEALRKTKAEHTEQKLKQTGYFNVDDDGRIPWPEPIPFIAKPNHPSGGCYGAKCIGENFRAWLDVHPVYIHPMSALAGAWITYVPGVGGWRPEDRPAHLRPLHEKYNLAPGIGAQNHFGPDMKIGLDLGWGGLLKKIRYYRDLNVSGKTSQVSDFYDGEEQLVLGVQTWVAKHAVKAREMAAGESDPAIRASLLSIADMNEWLVDNAPRTLREACQFLAWFQSIDRMWGRGGALGQLDELLRPFYEADKAAGHITDDEEVVWTIASLFFNDPHYSQIGGPTPNGSRDLTSRISFLILEATHRLKIPSNIAVRVHDKLDPALLHKAVEFLFEDGTGVCYSCSGGLDKGFARNGIPIQLARMRAKVGCNWTCLPGIEYPIQDCTRQCLTKPFLLAFEEVTADLRDLNKTTTPGDAQPTPGSLLDALWERYVHHLGISVDVMKQGFDWHMERHARNHPEMVLDLFCHGPIERGLDASAGGVDIYFLTFDGVGLATVADSFAAIEQRVVNEKRLTWEELARWLANDFGRCESDPALQRQGENVRLMLKSIPRFGTGNSRADWWARRVAGEYVHLVRDFPTAKGYTVIPGLFSHGDVIRIGSKLGATPNGRHAGEMISHSVDPDPGFLPGGGSAPTAKANAVAAVQPGWGNSAPLQIDFDKHLAQECGGIEAVEAMITAHNAQGGTLVNINVISKQQILEAHADPAQYPDLVVRVTGYSAFFKMLSPEYRQQVVDRILAEE